MQTIIQSWFFFFAFTSGTTLYSQISDNYETDEDSLMSIWMGDRQDFTIENGELRLTATDAGKSKLLAQYTPTEEQMWRFKTRLEFDPSGSNQLQIYLWSADEEVETSDALFLVIGETGSNDAIQIWERKLNSETLLGRGLSGAVANGPVDLQVEIRIGKDTLSLLADYGSAECLKADLIVPYLEWHRAQGYFGWLCKYTSTRKDRFYFDDILIDQLTIDKSSPSLIDSKVSPNELVLVWNEKIINTSSGPLIEIEPQLDFVFSVSDNELIVQANKSFAVATTYRIHIGQIADCCGNVTRDTILNFSTPELLKNGDLLINEILFNPSSASHDFVEIYNNRSIAINLKGLGIANEFNGGSTSIMGDIIIEPSSYVVISESPSELVEYYSSSVEENIFENELPAFSNDEGNVQLYSQWGTVISIIDEVDYSEKWHTSAIDNADGVSLERISFIGNSQDANNWASASETVGFATPGAENSVRQVTSSNKIEIINKTFTPDSDGVEDEFQISFELNQPGYLITANVFTAQGYPINKLFTNKLVGTSGELTWDGRDQNGVLMPTGIYIVHLSFYNEKGVSFSKKFTTVLVYEK